MNLSYIDLILPDLGKKQNIQVSYQIFGQALHTAPIVLVNHALTGNSCVTGHWGWWKAYIGEKKTIDTLKYTIICFNIPGNGFDKKTEHYLLDYKKFSVRLIAEIFWKALKALSIHNLYAIVGGSLGGAIGWEMVFKNPTKVQYLLPIASHYQNSDWLIAQVRVQESILQNSKQPLIDARMHAMLLYRTPQSLEEKFKQRKNINQETFEVEDWLEFHGKKLEDRFSLSSYKLMNHLLRTIGNDVTPEKMESFARETSTHIHVIGIDTDAMFLKDPLYNDFLILNKKLPNSKFSLIQSIHGHDGFLIEYDQLHEITKEYF